MVSQSVQVTLTIAEAPAGFAPTLSGTVNPKTGVRDDLAAFQQAARSSKTALRVVSVLTCTATNGMSQFCNVQTPVYYTGAASDSNSNSGQPFSIALNNGLTVRPRFNDDGTVTTELSIIYSRLADASWQGVGAPKTVAESITTKHTFHNGETALVGGDIPHGKASRFYFATVTIIPPAKG